MGFKEDRVTTLFFDSYSTLVDVDTAAGPLEEHTNEPSKIANLWRVHSLMYTMATNHFNHYTTFYDLNRKALDYALDYFGIDADEETREDILSVYHDLEVFDDVRSGMERLGRKYDLYVLSNGNPDMLDSMIEIAEIGDIIDGYISADEIERYKPDAELYEYAARSVDTPIEEIAHTSAAWFDVQGAINAGMQGVWINRKDDPWVRFGEQPDLTIKSFHELADTLEIEPP